MKNLLVQIAILVIIMINSLLVAYVVMDLTTLFQLNVLGLSFVQFYGLLSILNVIRTKVPKKGERTPEEQLEDIFKGDLALLGVWGLLHVMYIILT